jgi:hypothetical protein
MLERKGIRDSIHGSRVWSPWDHPETMPVFDPDVVKRKFGASFLDGGDSVDEVREVISGLILPLHVDVGFLTRIS